MSSEGDTEAIIELFVGAGFEIIVDADIDRSHDQPSCKDDCHYTALIVGTLQWQFVCRK
jgi:hypothetical protein